MEGGRGIRCATCYWFGLEGAANAPAVWGEIERAGGHAFIVAAGVTQRPAEEQMVETIAQ